MVRFYELDETFHIVLTAENGGVDSFDFPDGFDFAEQQYFQIIDGALIEDVAKREADEAEAEARRQERINRSTIADLEDLICDLDSRLSELEG